MVEKVVCVTGASGYIASWLVKLLLQRGYTVKASVRSLSDPSKVVHLKALEGAEERLHLFEADLTDEGAFDTIVDGCEGVFHTASPVFSEATNPQKQLIEPAGKGTLSVLNSCKKVPSIKRVVITSSISSVMYDRNPPRADIIDESWFSDPTLCEEQKRWYPLSKALAEKAAWEFAEENGIDLVTLHPGTVIGPLLQPTLNFTSKTVVDFIREGKEFLPAGGVYRFVDIRDVGEAHILAFESPLATGRYCLVGSVSTSFELVEILKKNFPSLNIPPIITANKSYPAYEMSNEKAKSLGVKFTPLEDSLKDIVESLKDKNFINF